MLCRFRADSDPDISSISLSGTSSRDSKADTPDVDSGGVDLTPKPGTFKVLAKLPPQQEPATAAFKSKGQPGQPKLMQIPDPDKAASLASSHLLAMIKRRNLQKMAGQKKLQASKKQLKHSAGLPPKSAGHSIRARDREGPQYQKQGSSRAVAWSRKAVDRRTRKPPLSLSREYQASYRFLSSQRSWTPIKLQLKELSSKQVQFCVRILRSPLCTLCTSPLSMAKIAVKITSDLLSVPGMKAACLPLQSFCY